LAERRPVRQRQHGAMLKHLARDRECSPTRVRQRGAPMSQSGGRGDQRSFADSVRRRKLSACTARPKAVSVVSSTR
jgi:hypothetical protein